MKRFLFLSAILLFTSQALDAQNGFRLTLSGGIPVGDASDFTTFTLAVDAAHYWGVSEAVEAGVLVGYQHSFGDEINVAGNTFEFDDVQFLPVAASGRVQANPWLIVGVDAGYAVGINDGNDGGFYYAPTAGIKIDDNWNVLVQYRGVAENGGSFNSITAGVNLYVGGFGVSPPDKN